MPIQTATRKIIKERPTFAKICLAIFIFAIALTLRLMLEPFVNGRVPFITFFPAVAISALLCGTWPAVSVAVASAIAGAWVWEEPSYNVSVAIGFLFLFVTSFIIIPVAYARRFYIELKKREKQLAVVNNELIHRKKNLASVMSVVVTQTIKSNISREDIPQVVTGRIRAITMAEGLKTPDAPTCLSNLVASIVTPFAPPDCLQLDGGAVPLPARYVTPFALLLHELATNALKHGAWQVAHPTPISISWRVDNGVLDFLWKESALTLIKYQSITQGFGSVLISQSVMGATVRHEIKPEGAECRIILSLKGE